MTNLDNVQFVTFRGKTFRLCENHSEVEQELKSALAEGRVVILNAGEEPREFVRTHATMQPHHPR